MAHALFKMTRIIACIMTIFIICNIYNTAGLLRIIMCIILLFGFYTISVMYEKKIGIFTPTYFFIFIILYIVNSFVPSLYDESKINNLNAVDIVHGKYYGDFFWIFAISVIGTYCIIALYLNNINLKKHIKTEKKLFLNKNQMNFGYLGCVIAAHYYFFIDRNYEIAIVCVCYLSLFIFYNFKRYLLSSYAVVLVLIMLFLNITIRYKLVQIVFPLIMALLIILQYKYKYVNEIKVYLIAAAGVLFTGVYGVISEIIKLNLYWNGNYNILSVISNKNDFMDFFGKQFYRLFTIWIKLGGYIIHHVQENGFFYGITYIKSLSNIFDFDYISLPLIAASYQGSSYSQPGLVAEGFANFGIIGAILNLCCVFFVFELTYQYFHKTKKFAALMLCVVPFTKILLDGGSLNSTIYMIVICLVVYNFSFSKSILLLRRLKCV